MPNRVIFWLYYDGQPLFGIPGFDNMSTEQIRGSALSFNWEFKFFDVSNYAIANSEIKIRDPKDFTRLVTYG